MQKATLRDLTESGIEILGQLDEALGLLNPDDYKRPLELLNGNTIGKHYRHVIEFFQTLANSKQLNTVNYDMRLRDAALENTLRFASETLKSLQLQLQTVENDYVLNYEGDLSGNGAAIVSAGSSFMRELAYNIEHAVHHMAIIKIALLHYFPQVKLNPHFGVAASTLRHERQKACAQ